MSYPRLFPCLVPAVGTGTAHQEPQGPRAVFPEAPSSLHPDAAEAAAETVPVSWGLGRTSTALAEGTEGLCFPSSPPPPPPPVMSPGHPAPGTRVGPIVRSRSHSPGTESGAAGPRGWQAQSQVACEARA